MRVYFISLKFSEPIYIGDIKPKSNFLITKDYIPGALVRGALAEWLISKHREREISDLIERIRFGNFFPSNSGIPSMPLPMTAMTCKNKPGFASSLAHGVCDILIPQVVYLELERYGKNFPVPFTLTCQKCCSRLDKYGRFYFKESDGKFHEVKLERVSQTKVALSRRRRVAQEGMLYHITALRPSGISFVGRIWIQEEGDFELLLEALNESSLGGLTTRGYGKVKEAKPLDWSWDRVKDRLKRFNEALREVWGELAELSLGENEPKYTYFTIDLLSPAVLKDPYGIPSLRLDPQELGLKAKLVHWIVRPGYASGWSTAWGLPKESVLTALEGSSFVYRVEEAIEDIAPILEEVEESGVGDRVEEGFGEIIVCHPFHMEVNPV
ncbi:MAG: CRISPR-associated RAMP protein Csx10 [Thermoproteota archaeon]